MLYLVIYTVLGLTIWLVATILWACGISRTGRPDRVELAVGATLAAIAMAAWPLALVGWVAWTMAARFDR